MLDVIERLMDTLIKGGVPPKPASMLLDRLDLYIGADAFEGWMLAQRFVGDDGRTPQERGQEWIKGVRDYFAPLPTDRYPTLVANVAEITGDANGDER